MGILRVLFSRDAESGGGEDGVDSAVAWSRVWAALAVRPAVVKVLNLGCLGVWEALLLLKLMLLGCVRECWCFDKEVIFDVVSEKVYMHDVLCLLRRSIDGDEHICRHVTNDQMLQKIVLLRTQMSSRVRL